TRIPPSRRLRIDDSDGLDLDHEVGTGEASYADRRAGRRGDAEIAHAHIGTFLEFVEIGDEGIGLDDVGPSRAGGLEAAIEVLEGLLHLGAHVAFADAVAVGIASQLAGDVDDLAGPAHRHDVRV